ncbi:uncharacterized protein B0H18DRAFT_1017929 [Fomitopsis serialis]|uniref:uncharacterized protein n=1 Tax=Fomitopsis serialis TaxID=139415 RepID=UPI002007C922|nr:uncharacterized protein B0H18DRAFT_1017929 [Neoantrodia serialis]KAH9922509.1 hypothetical protein B0H18DRAFT_1017929 [Neoantrodia serialis]
MTPLTLRRLYYAFLRLLLLPGSRHSPKIVLAWLWDVLKRCSILKATISKMISGQRHRPIGSGNSASGVIYLSEEPAYYPDVDLERGLTDDTKVRQQRDPDRAVAISHSAPTYNHQHALGKQTASQDLPPHPYIVEREPHDGSQTHLGTCHLACHCGDDGLTPFHIPLCPRSAADQVPFSTTPSQVTIQSASTTPSAMQECPSKYTVQPMQTKYPLEGVPDGWEAVTHPEGGLYFYDPARKIYTEAWLCDPDVLDEIEDFAAQLRRVVLELEVNPTKETKHYWTYYFVNHDERVLFWLGDLRGLYSALISAYYWHHWESFPVGQVVTDKLRDEALCILIHANIDRTTSATSTVGMISSDMDRLTSLLKLSKDLGSSNQYTAWVLGRVMCLFANDRYLNFFGQKVARLDRLQSLFDNDNSTRTPWIRSFSVILFNHPLAHLRSLEKVWIDGIINANSWERFVADLRKEWLEAAIPAAVLLCANVSFLGIADVNANASPQRTPAQITSLVSTIACVFSAIIGMQLIRQYRVKPRETAEEAATYLHGQWRARLGMETLAIVHSLPHALLLWAVLAFMAALALECFGWQDKPTVIATAVAWGLAAISTALCVRSCWEGSVGHSLHDWALQVRNKVGDTFDGSSQHTRSASTPGLPDDDIRDDVVEV